MCTDHRGPGWVAPQCFEAAQWFLKKYNLVLKTQNNSINKYILFCFFFFLWQERPAEVELFWVQGQWELQDMLRYMGCWHLYTFYNHIYAVDKLTPRILVWAYGHHISRLLVLKAIPKFSILLHCKPVNLKRNVKHKIIYNIYIFFV